MDQKQTEEGEGGPRRSSRLAPPPTSAAEEETVSETRQVGRESDVIFGIAGRTRQSFPKRASAGSVIYPSLSDLDTSPGPKRFPTRNLFSGWINLSSQMRLRHEELRGTEWKPILEVKGEKIVETWIYYEPLKTSKWQTICIDGTTGQMDENDVTCLEARYISRREEIDECYLYPDEVAPSVSDFCRAKTVEEIISMWGAVSNPLNDYLTANFHCAACGKTRKLRYLHARDVLTFMPAHTRRCEVLGRRCGEAVMLKGYHPIPRVLEQLVMDIGGVQNRQSEVQEDYASLHSTGNVEYESGRPGGPVPTSDQREDMMDGNTLAILKSMGRQGVSVKAYDGKGGGASLRIWGESLRRYFRLFNIREGVDQVTIATCFLEGKAKDWWDNICLTEQQDEIGDIEQLIHRLQLHFRPLNEDINLSLQWRNLQQHGDINAYRQQVYQLRAQFPFGEVAEFCLTYHGLRKELRAPVLSELWKLNTRHLPLAQLFELAAQAEVTSGTTLFPRFTERLRQEANVGRLSGTNRGAPWNPGGQRYTSWSQRGVSGWNQQYRPPPMHTPTNQPVRSEHRPAREARQPVRSNVQRTEEQAAWIRKRPCWICDKTGHLIRECTKRKPTGCPRCGKDHQLKVCPDRPKAVVACVGTESESDKDLLQDVSEMSQHQNDILEYRVKVNGLDTLVMVDTGAQLSLISQAEAERLGVKWDDRDIRTDVVGADGEAITIKGSARVTVEFSSGRQKEEMFVAHPLRHTIIFGLPWIRKHAPSFNWNDLSLTFASGEVWTVNSTNTRARGLVTRGNQPMEGDEKQDECLIVAVTAIEAQNGELKERRTFVSSKEVQPLLQEFADIFEPLTGIPPEDRIQHAIELVPGAKPVMKRPYRLAEAQLKEVEKQISGALSEGWVQPSYSPWGTAIFVVGKKNGEWRMCVDYRDLNALTEQDAYPLPRIDDILHKVASSSVFTTLDLQSGYHQIQIRAEDRPKTAFRLATPVSGTCHYEWKVMPFGLKNAPPTFQRYMSLVLKDAAGFCDVYMDDIIIYSNTMEEHIEHVREVFTILRLAKLKVKLEKCTFGQRSVEFLGHVLKDGRIWMRPEKQQVIRDWHEPLKTAKEVRQFLGLASYYRNYVVNFATIAAPLINLTRKRAAIQWTWEVQEAFRKLKEAISQNIGRVCWDSSSKTRVITDASGVGLGAVLEQYHSDRWETVAVWSRALNGCQRNYSILDKEWLAILEAVTRVWRHWLTGHQFEIYTDHSPLVQILTKKVEDLTSRQLRWLERLEPFSFTIKYIKGNDNVVADALSREVASLEVNAIEVTDGCGQVVELGLRKEDVVEAIQQDSFYLELLKDVTAQLQLAMENREGVLYTSTGQLCVPKSKLLRFKLVLEHHDQAYAGHWSVEKTLAQLKQSYYWPTMSNDVQEVVDTCGVCQRSRFQKKVDRAPIRFIEAQYPWEVVTVDFVSGFAPTKRKHTAICVICDRFTRMMHAESCKDHETARETAKIMIRRIFRAHGCPRVVLSDRGAQFDSELWRCFWEMMGTRVHLATTHHPQSNGLTERMNRTLIGLIRKVTQHRKNDWDELLPLLEFAYNQTPNSTTGVAPFEAQQGYLPVVPSTLLAAAHWQKQCRGGVKEFITSVRKDYQRIHKVLRETEEKALESVKAREDARRKAPEFFVGDEVLVYWEPFLTYSTQPRKQRFRYQGPFIITEVKHPHCVRLDGLPDKMPDMINVEYVHLFKRSREPELVQLRDQQTG